MTSKILASLIADIMTALANCSMYTRDHPAVLHLSGKVVATLNSLWKDDAFSIAILGDSLVVNNAPVQIKSIHVSGLIKKMKRRGIETVRFARGIDAEELKRFIVEMTGVEKLSDKYDHISYGIIEVRYGGGEGGDPGAITAENVAKLREVYSGISRYRTLDLVGLEEIVMSFIQTLRQEANVLRVISPVKSYSEYTYTHNTNVAILSIFQAELLGMNSELVYDIGVAGLLHDVGKLFVSRELLDKPGKLTDDEWTEMRTHPAKGAYYLTHIPEVPKVALIAAYEHHMKLDGSGYPGAKPGAGGQHVVSQIVAIADFFDALRSDRPYRKTMKIPVVAALLEKQAGREFSKPLVENFLRALGRINVL